jgi:hypothetical protein
MKPAQQGMIVGLIVALLGGILIGARYGSFMILVGGVAGLVAVFALVPVAIGLLTFMCRLVGIDPHLIEERIALLATWGVAVAAAVVSAAWILGPR